MTICNHTVEPNLVKVGCLKLQHLVDTSPVDRIRGLENLLVVTLATEASGDELLTVLVQQVESRLVSTGRDFDQLCKTVPDLSLGKSFQEGEVQESVHGSMVSSKTILVVAVVDSNLDTDTSIDQTNDRRGNANVVGVPAVRRTSKSAYLMLTLLNNGKQARVP